MILFRVSLIRAGRDGLISFLDDTASGLGTVLLPERFWQLGCILLLQRIWTPRVEVGKGDALRLRRAVGSGTGLGQILLMVRLGIVPQTSVLVVVGSGGNFSGNGPTELLLVCLLGRFDELLLFIVEVVETRSVLRAAIVPLSHPACRIVSLPEPSQNVDKGYLCRIVHYTNPLGMAGASAAGLLVRWIGSETGAVPNGRRVDPSLGR
mmetsp:Transcript_19408/g.41894  ORF Transcript_19408/g.41894 Transcript_19408/m.41894 type:complete len:208 (-) Transcript_19408:427-1050(-)